MEMDELKLETLGYIQYKKRLFSEDYATITLQNIVEHRANVVEKIKYKKLDLFYNMGVAFSDGIFIPVDYDGVIVDADDVFAITYITDLEFDFEIKRNEKFIAWVLFTNDLYIPIMPMISMHKVTLWDRIKKANGDELVEVLQEKCPNLTYPITEIEDFENSIKKEHAIRGGINKRFVLEQLYDAKQLIGLFDTNTLSCEIGGKTRKLLKVE